MKDEKLIDKTDSILDKSIFERLADFYKYPKSRAVGITFALLSILYGSWLARLPEVQRGLSLSDGELGIGLLGTSIGALLVMPFTSKLIPKLGVGKTTTISNILLCATIILPILSFNLITLTLALVFLGITTGLMDVAMNAAAASIEKTDNISIMSSCHGMFSLGGMLGAGSAGFLAGMGVPFLTHMIALSILVLITAIWVRPVIAQIPNDESEEEVLFVFPPKAVWGIVLIGFIIMLAEGSVMDWSAVYLRNTLESGAYLSGLGFAGFSLTMAIGRFMGDAIIPKYGAKKMILGGSILALIGFIIITLFAHPIAAIIGFTITGIGLSCTVPILFSAAARVEGVPHSIGIASVSIAGIVGFLIGPPLIGFIAESFGLQMSFGFIVILVLIGIGVASRIKF